MNYQTLLWKAFPLVGSGIFAYIIHRLSGQLLRRFGRAEKRVAAFAGFDNDDTEVEFGSQDHRVRLAFATVGLDVSGNEQMALWIGRIVMGAVVYLILQFVVGFPPLACWMGFPAGMMFANSLVEQTWTKVRMEVEEEIPIFLYNLSSVVKVEPNIIQALKSVSKSLKSGGSLRNWLGRLTTIMQASGRTSMEEALKEARLISPSLGVAVFLIGRLWETGGEGYTNSFSLAAESLEGVLNARVLARSKGGGARGAVAIVMGMMLFVSGIILRDPQLSAATRQPFMQLVYAGVVLAIFFGWQMISEIVSDVV